MVRVMPMAVFQKQKIYPQQGMVFSFDNSLGKVTAVSGGRVTVDFNNPMAGKPVVYELNVKRKVEKNEEKVKALMALFFRKEFPFKIEGNKIIIEVESKLKQFFELFNEKFKSLLNLELEVKEKKEKEDKSVKEKN